MSESDDIKRTIGNPGGGFFQLESPSHRVAQFLYMVHSKSILKRIKIVEISLNRKAEEEKKKEARVVELDVTEGQYMMLNAYLRLSYCACQCVTTASTSSSAPSHHFQQNSGSVMTASQYTTLQLSSKLHYLAMMAPIHLSIHI